MTTGKKGKKKIISCNGFLSACSFMIHPTRAGSSTQIITFSVLPLPPSDKGRSLLLINKFMFRSSYCYEKLAIAPKLQQQSKSVRP